jgi:putative transposase
VGLRRQRSLQVVHRDDELLPCIQALKAAHPFWGYRRIWAYLRDVEQRLVTKKRILRLRRAQQVLVTPNRRLKAKRTPTGSNPLPTQPNAWGGIAMTKVLVEGVGGVYRVIVLEWSTKQIVGYYTGTPCTARHGLMALDMVVQGQCPDGAQGHDVSLMSDHGWQPTSRTFMEACRTVGSHQAFTSDHHPKGNAATERVMRTVKEECLWLQEWTCPVALGSALERWITHDNAHYLHSTPGDKPPRQCEREYYSRHSTPFGAA